MRIGLFGGSFDPVHLGHLLLAETCREAAGLDQVLLTPAHRPPHKRRELTDGAHRLAMLRLAVSGDAVLRASDLELRREGISYTVDTLRALRAEWPAAELFLLLGADSLSDLPQWREPAEILQLAQPLVVQRPGSADPDMSALQTLVSTERIAEFRHNVAPMPAIEISSTELRARVAAGRSIRYRTPAAVQEYIRHHQLYRDAADRSGLAPG